MNKKALTETDIRTKFITPAITGPDGAKWNVMTQVREEVFFTKGRVIVRGKTVKRGDAKKADYLLDYKPKLPLAVVEAKDNNHAAGAGMPQALEYAEILDLPFAYSSNGDAYMEHYRKVTAAVVERSPPSYVQESIGTTGTAQPTIPLGSRRNFAVPLRPLAEQRRIVAKVENLMALVDVLETQLTASRATAANLLSALVAELTAG